jgi:hypothetical protein
MTTFIWITVRVGLHALLIICFLSIVALLAQLVIKKLRKQEIETPKLDRLVRIGTILATSVAAAIAMINLVKPIRPSADPDEGQKAIEQYYSFVERGLWEEAFKLLHPERVSKIRETNPTFSPDFLKQAYLTTLRHEHFRIYRIEDDSALGGRVYRVSFDVDDSVPGNSIYELRKGTLESFLDGASDDGGFRQQVLEDVDRFLIVPEEKRELVLAFIQTRPVEALFDPTLISEIRRRHGLKSREPHPPLTEVSRHLVLEVKLLRDNGVWKIRDGLADPKFAAVGGTVVAK